MVKEVNERDIVWPKFIEDRDIELINRYAMYNDLRILLRATFACAVTVWMIKSRWMC